MEDNTTVNDEVQHVPVWTGFAIMNLGSWKGREF
jgi:hypothetical protein